MFWGKKYCDFLSQCFSKIQSIKKKTAQSVEKLLALYDKGIIDGFALNKARSALNLPDEKSSKSEEKTEEHYEGCSGSS